MQKEYRSRPRDEAAELIECYIIENELEPHAKLPSERAICEMWGFNRATLRSAIRKLMVEGKLYSRVGSGTYVAPPKLVRNLQDMESVQDIARKAGKKLETRLLFAEVTESNKQVAKKLQKVLGHKVFSLQRLRLIDGIPVWIEIANVDYELCPGIEKHDFTQESLYRVMENEYGVRVNHGTESLGITYATEQEGDLLQIPPGTAVFFMSGVGEHDDTRVEYFKSIIRADQIEFVSVLTR